MLTGKKIIIQGGTDAANMKCTRRTGRETYSDFSFCHSFFAFILNLELFRVQK